MLRRTELFSTPNTYEYNTDMRAGDNMGPIGSLIDLKNVLQDSKHTTSNNQKACKYSNIEIVPIFCMK